MMISKAIVSIFIGATQLLTPTQSAGVFRAVQAEDENEHTDLPPQAQEPSGPPTSADQHSTNPFQKGCLRFSLGAENFRSKRVCNSDDPEDAAARGLCDDPPFDYQEIRITNQDWEGAMYSSWIMQILLSELLGVPTTIETSSPDRHFNFYDPQGRQDSAAKIYDFDSLRMAKEVGDCRKIKSGDNKEGKYKSCAHIVPMVSKVGQATALQKLRDDGIIENARTGGNSDQYKWRMPKKYAKQNPALLSFYGIGGEENRHKMAESFNRPTDWGTYCKEVSPSGCEKDDDIAARAPEGDEESGKFFVDGSYTGHFRATDKNNCAANPETCTGHIANVPCDWGNYAVPQAYHLNISVESDGNLQYNAGYGYSSLLQIYAAANATGSNVLMYWWEPDALLEIYRGTDYELVPIILPPTTTECEEHRVPEEDRCAKDFTKQIGSPAGSCDAGPVLNAIPMTLDACEESAHSICSPAYSALQNYQLTNLNLQQIYKYHSNDPNRDSRRAVCRWFSENVDTIKQTIIPKSYPRQPREKSFYWPLTYFSTILAAICIIIVAGCAYACKRFEKTKVMRRAQVDFLLIMIAGIFLVALGGLFYSIPPTTAVCISRDWLVVVGYSLHLIPLGVKVKAINHIVRASMRFRHVEVKRRRLYQIVGGCIVVICIYLTIWAALDPTIPKAVMNLSNEMENGKFVVEMSKCCQSSSGVWQIATSLYLIVLLLILTVIATQNRHIKQEFNESRYLALMIYSHFMFTLVRLTVFVLGGNFAQPDAVSAATSILLSLDILATIGIYLMPKFIAVKKEINNSGGNGLSHGETISNTNPLLKPWPIPTP